MKQTTNEIRSMFLNFFSKKNHTIIPSSALIPNDDATLLFTNAGMNQFKNIFLGKENPVQTKVATVQNCLRTGGKHNDLDNIGKTPYHHTFFEMLGNFSFGEYFKKESILYAWELLTSPNWFNLDKKKFIITVHSRDHETYNIWKNDVKISTNLILKVGNPKKFEENCDNFWQMGETGPCGPSTEIFFNNNKHIKSSTLLDDINKNKFLEIWNIVFIQFNRIQNKKLLPLSKLSVDTGMGLERISSIIQNVHSGYEIDLFQILMQKILSLTNVINPNTKSLRIIADHIRSASFIILENIIPSNEKRGYILRKIIRRAMLHGIKLKIRTPFLYTLIPSLIKSMSFHSLLLKNNENKIQKIIKIEEINFNDTLKRGLKQLQLQTKNTKSNIIDGKIIFYLYDTYGFPIDLIKDICQEKKLSMDISGFQNEMKKQKKRSVNNNFNICCNNYFTSNVCSKFDGYEITKTNGTVLTIYTDQKIVNTLLCGQIGAIILDKTTFYGESGGQVGDTGILYNTNATFRVTNTRKYMLSIIHEGMLIKGNIHINDCLKSEIDLNRRLLIQANHTATHLLHASLQKILGSHVCQQGSFINDKYLRFDFSHTKFISNKITNEIELLVNSQIQKNIHICITKTTLEKAHKKGIHGLLNKKYQKNVRIVSINNFSQELCGGTHSIRTGDIGIFKIISNITKIASNTYRINAVTKIIALQKIHQKEQELNSLSLLLHTNSLNITTYVRKILKENNTLKKQIISLETENNYNLLNNLEKKIIIINQIKILIYALKNKNSKLLRILVDNIKNKLKVSIIVLINSNNNRSTIIIKITKNLTKKINANEFINILTKKINGKGGGKSEIAEGGGNHIKDIDKFLKNIYLYIKSKL